MAEPAKKKRLLKKAETVRERSARPARAPKTRRLHKATSKLARPAGAIVRFGKKEYYLPMPDTKLGRFLNKRRSLVPRFLINSFNELRQVTWPTKRATFHMTISVFVFAVFFGLIIAVVDFGLDKLFKELIIK